MECGEVSEVEWDGKLGFPAFRTIFLSCRLFLDGLGRVKPSYQPDGGLICGGMRNWLIDKVIDA
jgi:hypothetical protein